jgi:hypothetical protein
VSFARLYRVRWAAWLGVLALVVNALVPIHLAFDLAEAGGAAHPHGAHSHSHAHSQPRSVEWLVLARLSGHNEPHGKSHEHGKGHATACPVCSAIGTLAGFAPAAVIALPLPPPATLPVVLAAIGGEPSSVALAYRSRAPPVV